MAETETQAEARKQTPIRDRFKCWRCGSPEIGIFNSQTAFLGGFIAIVCAECRNDYDLFVKEQPVWRAYLNNEDALFMANFKTAFDGKLHLEETSALRERQTQLGRELFFMTESFINDRIEREQPLPETPAPLSLEDERKGRERRKRILQACLRDIEIEEQATQDKQAWHVAFGVSPTKERENK